MILTSGMRKKQKHLGFWMAKVFLLDTHALIWAASDPVRLSPVAQSVIESSEHRILVSVVSLWELSIKQGLGKISLPDPFFDTLFDHGYSRLPISDGHLSAYRALPLLHRDPFDRFLIAQAQSEHIPLISNDPEMQNYDVEILWSGKDRK